MANLPLAELAKQLGVNLQTGLLKAEVLTRAKAAKKEASSKELAHLVRVKRDSVYHSNVPVEQLVAGDVIWMNAGDVCGVEARLFDGSTIAKALKSSLSPAAVFAAGDRVESGCGEALVLQPCKSAVLKAKVEHLLNAQPPAGAHAKPHELHHRSAGDLHETAKADSTPLRKSGSIPSTSAKMEKEKFNVAVLDAKRVVTMSRVTCLIIGIRGLITMDKTAVESVYADGRLLSVTDAEFKGQVNVATSTCRQLLQAALLCHTVKLEPSQAELHDSVLPPSAVSIAAAMRLYSQLGISIADTVAALPTLATQDVSASKRGGEVIVFMRGAFTNVRLRCSSVMITDDKGVTSLEKGEATWKDVGKQAKELGKTCEDLWAYAIKTMAGGDGKLTDEILNAKDYAFLGMVASSDPIREFAPEALGSLQTLKTRVILATAESANYARVIAKKASFLIDDTVEDIAEKNGLMPGEVDPQASQALVSGTGTLLSELHGNEFDDALLKKQLIFANVTSKQRVYLVDAMKQRGDYVGIIVESSQDIGAAQKSDLVFAFQCSVDACKEVATLISLNDSLASLVYALNEGTLIINLWVLRFVVRSTSGSPRGGAKSDKEACVVQ